MFVPNPELLKKAKPKKGCVYQWLQILVESCEENPESTPQIDPPPGVPVTDQSGHSTGELTDCLPFYDCPKNLQVCKKGLYFDTPSLPACDTKRFETYLVVVGDCIGKDQIGVLAGFGWNVGQVIDASNCPQADITATAIDNAHVNIGAIGVAISKVPCMAKWHPKRVSSLDCCFEFQCQLNGQCGSSVTCGDQTIRDTAPIVGLNLGLCCGDGFNIFNTAGGAGTPSGSGASGSGATASASARMFETTATCSPPSATQLLSLKAAVPSNFARTSASLLSDGICARVRLRLEQDAVLTRDAFRATLEVINSSSDSLQDLGVAVVISSPEHQDATELFDIKVSQLTSVSAVDGTGVIGVATTGKCSWILIPTRDAAPVVATLYLVSGTLHYSQNGIIVNVPLAEVPITVYPSPLLKLDYFHQRDVFADDPFTEQIEPSIPYSLGVMVQNAGNGTARNFHIVSAQPKIVENEKGLLIDFKLIATEVAGQNLTPSLTANFGDIGPGQNWDRAMAVHIHPAGLIHRLQSHISARR